MKDRHEQRYRAKRIATMSHSKDRQKAKKKLKRNPVLTPYFDTKGITLYHGDCLTILSELPEATFDAVITDPPYCSGGTTLSAKSQDPSVKYCQDNKTLGRPTFGGDAKDQRSFIFWCSMWMSLCRRKLKETGYALAFTDWRQLPATTDYFQAAGLTWRGVIAWNKGRASRSPHKGYFRHQCEYLAWGSNGKCRKAEHAGPYDGCVDHKVSQSDKWHMTGKPTELMKQLVEIVPPGGIILDPFAGSATIGVACALTGRHYVGIEQSEEYCEISAKRLAAAVKGELLSAK